MIPKKLIEFLKKSRVKFEILEHRIVYTAFDKAQTLRTKQNLIGKTLILKIDGNLVIALISAKKNFDKNKFKKISKKIGGKGKIDFASERNIKSKLKGVKVGAIPPFGNFWKIPTFVDKSLMKEREIILNGGNYDFSIRMKPKELKKIVPDLIPGSFSQARK